MTDDLRPAPRLSRLARPTRQWVLLACLFLLSLPAVTPRIYSSDEIQYFAYLRSIWFDHDLSFENEYTYFYDRNVARSEGFHETFLERTTDTGRRLNFGTIGCAILWSPFYAAGHAAATISGAPKDGFSQPYIAAVAYGSAVYGFLAIVLAILCTRRLGFPGFTGAIAVWLGTPLLFYMYVAPPFSHACSAFTVALFTFVWLRVRDDWSPRGLAALGAVGALMAMTREQDVFFIAGPALDFAISMVGREAGSRRWEIGRLRAVLAAGVCFVAVYTPQLITYKILNGHFGPHASVAHKMSWSAPHALQVLMSPEHGFFFWTPLAALGIAGLFFMRVPPEGGNYGLAPGASATTPAASAVTPVVSAVTPVASNVTPVASAFRRNDHIWICLLLVTALQVYVGGSVESWTVAGGFGQRRFVALTTVLVIGVSALIETAPVRKAWIAVLALCVYWNVALTAEFATGLMNRQWLEPGKNAYDAFVTLPRTAPDLVYRYLFDRQSFYQHGR